ncbi:lipopolysaccharide biosynthesis protein [Pedobacter heparinus]|uniref:lipopolysaccharide biosynthesis protein n=1 Tax=Pedobacter heparinus TaxID=984 RepID=UPI00292E262C|nr:lipopolysaccharide biosynthesis protein [Pedobacter heparinus]
MIDESNTIETKQEEISLEEFLIRIRKWYSFLLSKWAVIISFILMGSLIGLALSYLIKPIYTATTTFVLENGEGGAGLGQYAGLASMAGIDLGSAGSGGNMFQGDNILELYKSRNMIQKTLLSNVVYPNGENRPLIDRFIEFNKWRKKWKGNTKQPGLETISFTSSKDSLSRMQDSVLREAVKEINKEYLSVTKIDKKLSIIKVEVKAKDEFFADVFNNEIVRNVNEFYIQTKTKKSLANIAILQRKTDSVRTVMTGAIYQTASISDATPNLNPTKQVQRAAPIQRSQFLAETNKTILGELVKNLELAKMSLLRETPLVQVIDKPILPLPEEHFGKILGMLLGGFIAGLFIVAFLVSKRLLSFIS